MLLLIAVLLTALSCKDIEPHGVYHSSAFGDYEHLVIDFWGSETIRIFGVKNGELELSKGQWQLNSNGTINIRTFANAVNQDLLASANHFLSPFFFVKDEFKDYKKVAFQLEMEILSFEELKEMEFEKIFKAYEVNDVNK